MGEKDSSPASTSTPSSDAAWSNGTATRFENKAYSEYFDPCQEAAQKSIRCLHRNGGERAMCSDFFQAYRDCKEQWMAARKEARKKSSWFG
ncbi:cytochrome c oxidase-like protein-assembly factor COX23 [Lentithecium fluviatile CBS 122367]|uniref:Cytochrome c oxidase-like protein-assembly factor COX23 n=1 Tax=Lentithecium fluviatile CBS 122367 TaxID=1168545 RepID=A0A6G1J3C5_9PLEO|nr:cytochrome c oxidase-like protein-assembly factor COX23 [Lentithecium fluviatile CBS 122367]